MEFLFESEESKLYGLTIFISTVAFQIAYIFLQWIYVRRDDFLYYIAYMISTVVYGLSEFENYLPFKLFTHFHPGSVYYTRHSLPLIATFLYFRFSRSFLDLPVTRPQLNVWVKRLEYLILSYSLLAPVIIACGVSIDSEFYLFIIVLTVIFAASALIIISFLKQSVPLTRFAMLGAGFLVIGSIIFVIVRTMADYGYQVAFDPYMILLFCVIAELLTFTTGLTFKTRLIEFEKVKVEKTLMLEIQKKQQLQIELLQVRSNIARDLHDEIGSGLSKISLLGEVIRKDGNVNDNKIEKIISSAKEMVGGMSEMIWSLNTKNDFLDNLVSYLRKYAVEYFEHTNVTCKVNAGDMPHMLLPGEQRRNIFLAFKEALHNITKHAGATEVEITFAVKQNHIYFTIHDNGKGFDSINQNTFGNGLSNMQERMQQAGGSFEIMNEAGTKVMLSVPAV